MAGNEKFATDMRDALKGLMDADPYYLDVEIVTERLQNIDAKVEAIVAKAGGICLVLVTATFEKPMPNIPGANFEGIRFVARVFENVKTNPTGKEAQHVAIYTAALWSQLKPDSFSSPLKLDDPGVSLGNDPRFLTYDVQALTEGGTKIEIPRLEDVTIGVTSLATGPVATFSDGSRDFVWREGPGLFVQAGHETTDADVWAADRPAPNASESLYIYQTVAGVNAGLWRLERIDGVWQVTEIYNSQGSAAPALPDGFEFFTESLVALAHPVRGTAIFYTLNGSKPAPRNPAAALFLDPFSSAPGVTVRARAWLAGYISSAELRQVL